MKWFRHHHKAHHWHVVPPPNGTIVELLCRCGVPVWISIASNGKDYEAQLRAAFRGGELGISEYWHAPMASRLWPTDGS